MNSRKVYNALERYQINISKVSRRYIVHFCARFMNNYFVVTGSKLGDKSTQYGPTGPIERTFIRTERAENRFYLLYVDSFYS